MKTYILKHITIGIINLLAFVVIYPYAFGEKVKETITQEVEEKIVEKTAFEKANIIKEKITSENILFETNSAKLKPESYSEIYNIASLLNQYPDMKLEIIGYTDADGSTKFNKDLSLNRAKSVYNVLIRIGINKKRLMYDGKGENEPIASNTTELGKKKNRRVEINPIGNNTTYVKPLH